MFYHNINPTLLRLGPFEVRYYGIIFVLGFILAYFMIFYLGKKRKLSLTKDDMADLLFYLIIGVVAGSRVFYVLFYDLKFYLSNPLSIFAVWHGGLSFHGGFFGAIIAGYFFCKKKRIDFLELADIAVIPLSLALFMGRIGNFLNGEVVGRVTTVPWAVKFQGYEGFRHPSQLYEAFKNLIIFLALWFLKDKKLRKGALFFVFVISYSALRFFVEFFRAPDEQIGYLTFGLTMGQILDIAMFLVGLVFVIYNFFIAKAIHLNNRNTTKII